MSQDGAVRDFVLPLMTVTADLDGDSVRMTAFQGTGFLLADPADTVVTAGHVAAELEVGSAVVAFATDSRWFAWSIVGITRHHSEDLAVLRLAPGHGRTSPLFVGGTDIRASARYRLWGYPVDVMHEVVDDGIALPRPDLVYSEGHVRRRLSDIPLGHLRGSAFLELSAVAGSGCSGAPVTADRPGSSPWEVIGVYVGDRQNASEGVAVGFASRVAALEELLASLG